MNTRRNLFSRRSVMANGFGIAIVPCARANAQSGVGKTMSVLSDYMAAARDAPLPPDVAQAAKLHVLDTFAAMISGSTLTPGKAAIAYARLYGGTPMASVAAAGCGARPPRRRSRTVFSLSLTRLTTRTRRRNRIPAAPSCQRRSPPARLWGPMERISCARSRSATMSVRASPWRWEASRSATPRTAPPTPSRAGFGATAAAASVARLNAQQMRWALDYAAQQSSGIASWSRDIDHIEKAFVFGGMTARTGVTAALLVHAGWTGVDDVFSGPDNFFRPTRPTPI